MSDIVKRLRHPKASQAEMEAAAEIERLRSDVAALEDEIELKSLALSGTSKSMGDEIERLREDNVQLKIRIGTYYAGNPDGGIVKRMEGEIKRLHGLLREWLDDSIIGRPQDLERRSREALGNE